jgi:methyl-accepting chemotaxis protein
VGILIAIVLAVAFPRLLVAPIENLTQKLKDISSGNGDLTVRLDNSRKDEVGALASAFNHFVDKIHTLVREVSSVTSQVATAAEEMSVVAGETNHSIQRQHSETAQVATAINEMTATVQEVANSAEQAAAAASDADEQAGKGHVVLDQTVTQLDALAQAVEQAAEVIQRLDQGSQDIGRVIDVIRGIAEQTNLLALNAAIEAARAGDQGRGFAVVADEVRTLASRTQESTQEIQEMIERLQVSAGEAVSAMTSGRAKATETVTQANATRDILEAVKTAVGSISEMNTHIATASEEQSAVSSEIDRNITNISQIGEQTATGAQQTAASGEELARLAAKLQEQVGQFRV